jgi:hypothetical protein
MSVKRSSSLSSPLSYEQREIRLSAPHLPLPTPNPAYKDRTGSQTVGTRRQQSHAWGIARDVLVHRTWKDLSLDRADLSDVSPIGWSDQASSKHSVLTVSFRQALQYGVCRLISARTRLGARSANLMSAMGQGPKVSPGATLARATADSRHRFQP